MEESVYKEERRKIKIKERQLYAELELFCNKEFFLQETSSLENQQRHLKALFIEVTNMIDILIIDLEECEDENDTFEDCFEDLGFGLEETANMAAQTFAQLDVLSSENDTRTFNLEVLKRDILRKYGESEHKISLYWYENRSDLSIHGQKDMKNEKLEDVENVKETPWTVTAKVILEESTSSISSPMDDENQTQNGFGKQKKKKSFDDGSISRTSWRRTCRRKKGTDGKQPENENIREETHSEVAIVRNLLPLVLNNIGEQLGVSGSEGFYAASVTHYTLSQFAVVFGLSSCTMKMEFLGKYKGELIRKLEDLNLMVQDSKSPARKEALGYLEEAILELNNIPIDFKVTCDKFQRVRELAKKAVVSEADFGNMIVCTKYFIFAEMMVQAFSEGDQSEKICFLPPERVPETKRRKMSGYLIQQMKDLKKSTDGKGMRMDKHDDLLKMVYSILSVCKSLSNPNTIIDKIITFGIDIEFVPYKEENAAVLQLGWENKEENLKMEEIGDTDMKHMSPYRVYLWRSNNMLFVRRKIKIFTIPYQLLHGSIVYAKIERKYQRFGCLFGDNPSQFSRTAEEQACYPKNIQPVDALIDGAKKAIDLDSLPKLVYKQMQRISEACLLDLGIDVNEKDEEGKTLMHYVACLGMGVSGKTIPIDCLVDAGADLASQDSEGRTPLMAAIMKGSTLDKKKETLIQYCQGTPALNIADKDGNNVLHLLASMKESKFTKDTIKLLLRSNADAKHTNKDDFNPRDTAKYHKNNGVYGILDNWLSVK